MNKISPKPLQINYVETPRRKSTTVKIDSILEQRMKEFMLSRRRIRWYRRGE